MINKWSIFLVVTLYCSCQRIKAQERNKPLPSFSTIPFILTTHNNISIQAVVNKTDTVNLMFHTDAGSVTLTTEAIKKLKNINWETKKEVNSWGGKTTARYSERNSLEIGHLKWDNLAIWETQNSGPTTGGKFGPNLFKEKAIEIDFEKSIMMIHQTLPEKIKEFVKTPLIYENESMFIKGKSAIKGINYENRFLIHSGYGGTILFDDQFVLESKIGEKIDIIAEKELRDSYGNVLKTKKGNLPAFEIGGISFENIPIGFFEGTIGRQQMSVIGGDLLKRFNIIIDSNREHIYLKPNQLINLGYTEFQ